MSSRKPHKKPRYAPLEFVRTIDRVDAVATMVDDEVVCVSGTLTVRCGDANNNDIPGVNVFVRRSGGVEGLPVPTGLTGIAKFTLLPGTYRIRTQHVAFVEFTDSADVVANWDTPRNFLLRRTVILVRVTRSDGQALAATVTATPEAGGNAIPPSRTIAPGSYRFTDLPVGRYVFEANAAGYVGSYGTFAAVAGQTTTVNFTLYATVLRVKVHQPDGTPIANATVSAARGQAYAPDATGPDRYDFYDLAPGTYQVDAAADDYVSTGPSDVDVAQGFLEHTITLHRSLLYVKVTTMAAAPLPATVRVVDTTSARTYDQPVADAVTATYRFDDLPPGTYELTADAAGRVGMITSNYDLGDGRFEHTFTLYERVLQVTVQDPDGTPITGAVVYADEDEQTTVAGGICNFFGIGAGPWSVNAAADGWVSAGAQQVAAADGFVTYTFTLHRSVVFVWVRTTAAQPLPAAVSAVNRATQQSYNPSVPDDPSALYAFADLPAGGYDLYAGANGYVRLMTENFDVPANGAPTFTFPLPRRATLIVNVANYARGAVPGVNVTVTKAGTTYAASNPTTTKFTHSECDPGEFSVKVEATDYVTRTETKTLIEGHLGIVNIVLYRTQLQVDEFEKLLVEVTREAENEVNEALGRELDYEWCNTVIDTNSYQTNAMVTGTRKHAVAERLLNDRMSEHTLVDPYRLAIEQPYYRRSGQSLRLATSEREKGSIRPDIVLHHQNSLLQVLNIYDFKFTCPPYCHPKWRKETNHPDYQGKPQNEVYTLILDPQKIRLVNPKYELAQ